MEATGTVSLRLCQKSGGDRMAVFTRSGLFLVAAVAGCSPLIAGYSLQAYKNDTTLKADVAAMVNQSTTPYTAHEKDIAALTLRLNEAYEFSKGEATNALSTKEWQILLDPNGALYGKFIAQWHDRGQLSTIEAQNWKALLDRAFDVMICLEANKQQATKCPAPEAMPAANGRNG